MTYEDLLVAIDKEAPNLKCCALRVLLRLIAIGIEEGTNEVKASRAYLADGLGMAIESVDEATRGLAHLMRIEKEDGRTRKFVMPIEWFTPQRSLFVAAGAVEKTLRLPGNQARTGLETRQAPAQNPGRNMPGFSENLPGNQAEPAWNSREPAQNPGMGGLETRQVLTHNQQLGDNPLDRSNRVLSSVDSSSTPARSIERVNHLPTELQSEAEELKRWLRGFFGKHHLSHTVPAGPDEIILAKCLAIAPLPSLVGVLQVMNRKGTRPGDTWAWFVTVFCQRIHRTRDTNAVEAPPAFCQGKKNPSSEGRPGFASDLLQEVAAGVPRL